MRARHGYELRAAARYMRARYMRDVLSPLLRAYAPLLITLLEDSRLLRGARVIVINIDYAVLTYVCCRA